MNCDICERPIPEHDDWCELAPMFITKEAFITAVEGGVKTAIESYEILLGMGYTNTDALQNVIDESVEAASCFAGIGSCASGGCKH